ncbi:hypothetical protein B296_00045912 [Ensete ventricosum]|uniref:Uncharacterized protein n=1 Tax=Ensete ventricosum TaxID=4639 RepID=A0A426Z3Z2_ENSVE|nr:hypothetical protein B296_00045912 [Ensete ventricosum]
MQAQSSHDETRIASETASSAARIATVGEAPLNSSPPTNSIAPPSPSLGTIAGRRPTIPDSGSRISDCTKTFNLVQSPSVDYLPGGDGAESDAVVGGGAGERGGGVVEGVAVGLGAGVLKELREGRGHARVGIAVGAAAAVLWRPEGLARAHARHALAPPAARPRRHHLQVRRAHPVDPVEPQLPPPEHSTLPDPQSPVRQLNLP